MRSLMRLVAALVAALGLSLSANPAWAASPHFVSGPTVATSGNSLVVTASVAGLGSTVDHADFTLTGTVDVFSRCYNKGGNKPEAGNKQETLAVDSAGSFPVRNGRTNVVFTIAPLSSLTCPGQQVVVIESVSYDLVLAGEGLTAKLQG